MLGSIPVRHAVALLALVCGSFAAGHASDTLADEAELSLFDFLGTMVEGDQGWIDPLDMQDEQELMSGTMDAAEQETRMLETIEPVAESAVEESEE